MEGMRGDAEIRVGKALTLHPVESLGVRLANQVGTLGH